MSTRTNIRIKSNAASYWLYRHHDGYLGEAGADILKIAGSLQKQIDENGGSHITASDLTSLFLEQTYDATEYSDERPVYELTDNVHGDIEHLYTVELRGTGGRILQVTISHAARPANWFEQGPGFPDPLKWGTSAGYDCEAFAQVVNADRESMNGNIRERYPDTDEENLYKPVDKYGATAKAEAAS